MLKQSIVYAMAAVMALSPAIVLANNSNEDGDREVSINLKTHLEYGYPLQDVFIQSATDVNKVVRVANSSEVSASLKMQPLYGAATAVAHDYFRTGLSPLGPFDKGLPLKFTLGEWLEARGSGTYETDGAQARLDLSLRNLVPHAQYSVWCNRISFPPQAGVTYTPCGLTSGVNNTFMTDGDGDARFAVALAPLLVSTTPTATQISVVYHSDWSTHGDSPGAFGLYSHEQLLFYVPTDSGIVSPPPSASSCMQSAVVTRDNALIGVVHTYADQIAAALNARGTALSASWGMSDRQAHNKEIAAAWKTFIKSRNDARKQLNTSRRDIWSTFRSTRKGCLEHNADAGREGVDQAW